MNRHSYSINIRQFINRDFLIFSPRKFSLNFSCRKIYLDRFYQDQSFENFHRSFKAGKRVKTIHINEYMSYVVTDKENVIFSKISISCEKFDFSYFWLFTYYAEVVMFNMKETNSEIYWKLNLIVHIMILMHDTDVEKRIFSAQNWKINISKLCETSVRRTVS